MPDTTASELAQWVAQWIKPLLPPAVGVLAGMGARWSRDAKAGRVKSFRRMVLLDLPALGALSLVAGSIAQQLHADPLTASSIGAGVGYLGIEVINVFMAQRAGIKLDGGAEG